MKLFYGEYCYSRFISGRYVMYNYSGLKEGLQNVPLIPSNNDFWQVLDETEFDKNYADFIMTNPKSFYALMDILYYLSMDVPVYIVITNAPWLNDIFESFMRFIKSRYGITGCFIQSPEDIEYANETDFNPYFGIRNYDEDRVRYENCKEFDRIVNGGKPAHE